MGGNGIISLERFPCRVINALIQHARDVGCYKVILDCSEQNIAFYEKCGLERKEVQMVTFDPLGLIFSVDFEVVLLYRVCNLQAMYLR